MESQRPRAFLDITIDASPAGRLILELFSDKTPKTCENFLALCNGSHEGLTYALSPFHRIIDEFMIQGGDITKGDGTGGTSIYGGEFEDENLAWRDMDAAGLVCMANRGPGTNGSQFFITLTPCPHLNGKHTIFGRLVSGQDVLAKIAEVPVDKNDRPKGSVLISRCGELERKKRAAPAPATKAHDHKKEPARKPVSGSKSPSSSPNRERRGDDRNGRLRDEQDSRKRRRRSDQGPDETFRGRPKTRSESRSPVPRGSSDAMADDAPAARKDSPPRKHRRVRSRSPSRDNNKDDKRARLRRSRSRSGSGHEERRRRHDRPDNDRDRRGGNRDERDVDWRDRRREDRERGNRGGGYWDRDRTGSRFNDRRFDDRRGNGNRRYGNNDGRLNDGRLGGDEHDASSESGIKFKGRGSMKFREPDRR
ncbi:hypothetical protein KVT40_000550 [Elsinoe batatas]|uniref:peptidylprolyl isomerase n=1 Tax=Elsinoe batatas TaxID=2601811 RepID=A0A8K0PGI9_9PEZI|nr:hypothetical protein KVT40_000550 [Elsinoe batatas]